MWLSPSDATNVGNGGLTLVAIFGVVAFEGSVAVCILLSVQPAVIIFRASLPAVVTACHNL